MELIPLLTAIVGLVAMVLTIATGPSAKERQKQKEKEKFDEALRNKDLQTLSAMLSNERDRLHKGTDNPVR